MARRPKHAVRAEKFLNYSALEHWTTSDGRSELPSLAKLGEGGVDVPSSVSQVLVLSWLSLPFLLIFGTSVEVLTSPSFSTTVLTPLFVAVHHNFFQFFVRWLRAAAVSYWQIYPASQVWLKERDQTLSRGAKE